MIFHNFVKGFAMSVLDCIAQCLWKYRSNQKKHMYSLFWTCVDIILNIFLAAFGLLETFLWIVCVVFFDWSGRFLFYNFSPFSRNDHIWCQFFSEFSLPGPWTFTACFSVFFSKNCHIWNIFFLFKDRSHMMCFFDFLVSGTPCVTISFIYMDWTIASFGWIIASLGWTMAELWPNEFKGKNRTITEQWLSYSYFIGCRTISSLGWKMAEL
jgi:type IV secretory pathway TrbD component